MNKTFPVSLKKLEDFVVTIKGWCIDTFSEKHTHPYATALVQEQFYDHIVSSEHISPSDRATWNSKVGFPDYSGKQSLGELTSYKCESDCWIGLYRYSKHTVIDVYVNDVFLYKEGGEETQTTATLIPLRSGDTISTSVAIQYDLYPMR